MSVINQMLRDLDARRASEKERSGLPTHLRTLPPQALSRSKPWWLLAGGMAGGALIAGLVASFLLPDPAPAPVAASAAPPPVPAVAPEPQPEALRVASETGDMKLSTRLTLPDPLLVPEPPPPAARPAATAPPAAAPVSAAPVPEKPRPEAAKAKPEPPRPPVVEARVAPAAPAPAPAEAQIDRRVREAPVHDRAEAEYQKGLQAVRRGDHAAALPALQRALEIEPSHAKARQALLSVLVSSRQWNEARQVAQTGLAVDPTQSGLATILARLQFEQGDSAAALDTLARHALHAAGNADFQGLYAYLLQRQQRPAEAVQRFQAALALRPGEGRWWFGLGLSLESAGRPAEAKEAYARAKESGNLSAEMAAVVEQKLR